MASSGPPLNVRVGVRVRPLSSSEVATDQCRSVVGHPAVNMVRIGDGAGDKTFTFDHVFPAHMSQSDLFSATAAPMIQSFLDGYNVTIIAYGQTGSGKTFTMGSDAQDSSSGNEFRGFIPRFVEEVFARVNAPPPPGATSTGGPVDESTAVPVHDTPGDDDAVELGNAVDAPSTTVSFLEIYGEDIYDLLQEPEVLLHGAGGGRDIGHHQSKSLALREDNGSVSVVGLTEVSIADGAEAMEQLSRGTQHRTTASTLMNTVSSRSHAVFALTLHQKLFGEGYGPDGQEVVSRLSFVDLAGSERLKRTGAEGQRMKEGIQINKGLLALGNVINALADEEHQKMGQEKHVGYRESKLTRLLQDALGGNSQTLFLACISPAEVNLSETLSTLRYANRARNIQNKPVKNTDPLQEELRRLHECTKVLRLECVKERFGVGALKAGGEDGDEAGGEEGVAAEEPLLEDQLEQLLTRQDVKSYLDELNRRINVTVSAAHDPASLLAKRGAAPVASASLFVVPHGVGAPTPLMTANNTLKSRRQSIVNLRRQSFAHGLLPQPGTPGGFLSPVAQFSAGRAGGDAASNIHETSIVEESLAALGSGDEEALDPENDMRMINKLLDMVKKDEEFEQKEKEHQVSIGNMDNQIEEQEQILGQLKKNISQYQVLLEENDLLMRELHSLEGEKAQLVHQLTQQEKENAKTGGGSAAFVNKLKEKLKGVESRLRTQSLEQKKREDAMKLIKRDGQRCRELESNISELKRAKVEMVRKQKDSSARFKSYMDQKNRELNEARKSRRREKLETSKLQNENRKLQTAYTRKVKAHQKTEEALRRNKAHLMKLLAMRKRERQRKSTCQRVYRSRSSILAKPGSRTVAMGTRQTGAEGAESTSPSKIWASEDQALQSAKFCLMQMVSNRVQKQQQKEREQQLQSEYDLLQKQVYEEVGHLNTLKQEYEVDTEGDDPTVSENSLLLEGRTAEIIEHEERLEELVVKLDLVGGALSEVHLPAYPTAESPGGVDTTGSVKDLDDEDQESLEMDMLSQLDAPALRTLLWSVLDDHSEQEFQHRLLADTMRRKEAELKASELKMEKIEKNNKDLRRGFNERVSIMHSERIEFAQAVCSPSGKARRPGKGGKAKAGLRSPTPISAQLSQEEDVSAKELEALRAMNADLEARLNSEHATTSALQADLSEVRTCNMDISERLSLATSTLEQQSDAGRAEILSQLEAIQAVWGNVGTPAETRSTLLSRIETAPSSTAQAILDETRSGHARMLSDIHGLQKELRMLQVVAGVKPQGSEESGIDVFVEARPGENTLIHLNRLRAAREGMQGSLDDVQAKVEAVQKKAKIFTAKLQKYDVFQDAVQPHPSQISNILAIDAANMFTVGAMTDLLSKEGTRDGSITKPDEHEKVTSGSPPADGILETETSAMQPSEPEAKDSEVVCRPALLTRCLETWVAGVRDLAVSLAQMQAQYQDTVAQARSQLRAMGINSMKNLVALLWTREESGQSPVDTSSEVFASVCRHLLVPDAEPAAEARAHEADAGFLKCLVDVTKATALAHDSLFQVFEFTNTFLRDFFRLIFERLQNDRADMSDELSLRSIGKLVGEVDNCLVKSRQNVSAAISKLHAMWDAEKTPPDARVNIPPGYVTTAEEQGAALQLSEVSLILLGGEPIGRYRLIGSDAKDSSVLSLLKHAREEAHCIETQMTSITQGIMKVQDKISERGTIVRLDHDLNRLYAESSEFEEKNKDPSRLQDRTGKGRKALLHEESQRQLFQKSIRKTLVDLQRVLGKWEVDHGEKFDPNLLSEHGLEVRDDKSKAAIKDKTQLMHLESNMHIQAVNQRRESMEQQYPRRTSIAPRSVSRTPSPQLQAAQEFTSGSSSGRKSEGGCSPPSSDSSAGENPSVVAAPAPTQMEGASDVLSAVAFTPAPLRQPNPCASVVESAAKTSTKPPGKTNPFLKMVTSRRANTGTQSAVTKASVSIPESEPKDEQQENVAPPAM